MVAIAGGIILAILVLAALAAVVIGINLMKTDDGMGSCLIIAALIVLVPFGCSLLK